MKPSAHAKTPAPRFRMALSGKPGQGTQKRCLGIAPDLDLLHSVSPIGPTRGRWSSIHCAPPRYLWGTLLGRSKFESISTRKQLESIWYSHRDINIHVRHAAERSLHLKSSSSRPLNHLFRLTVLLVKLRPCTIEILRPLHQLQPISSPLPDPQSYLPNRSRLHAATDVLQLHGAPRMQCQRQNLPYPTQAPLVNPAPTTR